MPLYRHCKRWTWRSKLDMLVYAGSGSGLDPGNSFLNLSIWNRDRELWMSLHTPGVCITHALILYLLAQKYSRRTKPIVWGAWIEPLSQIFTIAWLSQWNNILWRDQGESHVWTISSIAKNSFQVISTLLCGNDQWDWIHLLSLNVPHPCTPEASV